MGATSQGGRDNPGVVQRHERRRRLGYSDRSTMESCQRASAAYSSGNRRAVLIRSQAERW